MHFLISGIPASGKSTFCRWLEEKKGFLHLDVEKPGVLDRYGLATAWDALFDASASAAPFIEALDKFKRPVVIDWGFPPEHLNTVRKLSRRWRHAVVVRRRLGRRATQISATSLPPRARLRHPDPKNRSRSPRDQRPLSARTWSTRCLPQASTLDPTKSGRACSTPSPDPGKC